MRYSIEAEQSVIGGLMLDSNKTDDVLELISAADFYNSSNKSIFESIEFLHGAGKSFDVVEMAEVLENMGRLTELGGFAHLIEMAQNTPSASNILVYARIVADRSLERKLAAAGQRIFEVAEDSSSTVDEKLALIHNEFAEMERGGEKDEVLDFNEIVKREVVDIDNRFRGNAKQGLHTGFSALDERFGGIEDTDLWIVAARPSMGKTTFALNVAYNVASQGKDVLIFSCEMSKEQLSKKMLSAASGINYGLLRSGKLKESDWSPLSAGVGKLKDKKIHIVDIAAIDIGRAQAIARKYARGGNLGLIIIDYLQLMTVKSASRFDEISQISRQLKVMAKNSKCPVMALSQLSRKCDERADSRPINSDLRESGQIEQDADIITFIYRDIVYNPNTHIGDTAEFIHSKFRNGETGVDGLRANLGASRFENLPYEFVKPQAETKTYSKKKSFD
jgi:replicative DNA helicase